MAALKIEWLKLSKKKSLKVLFVIYGLIVFSLFLMYFIGEKSMGLTVFNEGQFMNASLGLMMAGLLPFMTLYLSIGAINTEFQNGTIKNMFLMPLGKNNFYQAKFLSTQLVIGILLTSQFVFSFVIGTLFENSFSLTAMGHSIVTYIGAFLVLGMINFIGMLLGMVFKSTGIALLIAYVTYIASNILGFYLPRYNSIALTSIFKNYEFLFNGFNGTLLLSAVAYYIIVYMAGAFIFEKKEENICQSE